MRMRDKDVADPEHSGTSPGSIAETGWTIPETMMKRNICKT